MLQTTETVGHFRIFWVSKLFLFFEDLGNKKRVFIKQDPRHSIDTYIFVSILKTILS